MKHLIDISSISPGIQETVLWLRSHGFDTTDSGDGVSNHPMDCALPYPHVAMLVANPKDLVSEADRLAQVLRDAGLEVEMLTSLDEEWQGPNIEASYDPSNGIAIIVLSYLNDEVLREHLHAHQT